MFRILLLILVSVLAGCGTAAKKTPESAPVKAAEPQPEVQAPPPVDSLKSRILRTANEEWLDFGQQKVVFGENGEESIPQVGIWEDEDMLHIDRVRQYWMAVGVRGLSGKDCKEPWSAAFISWVMQIAGVPTFLFPPGSSHWEYLNHFIAASQEADSLFIPHVIREYKPKAGDLICATRGSTYFDETADILPPSLSHAKLHCDIVMETNGRNLQAIGGNVRNSVSRSFLTLTKDGYLQPTPRRPWFLVIENRLD